jgi:hypothetical protein
VQQAPKNRVRALSAHTRDSREGLEGGERRELRPRRVKVKEAPAKTKRRVKVKETPAKTKRRVKVKETPAKTKLLAKKQVWQPLLTRHHDHDSHGHHERQYHHH